MKSIYVAVEHNYLMRNWPYPATTANEAMSIIWRMFDVEFVRNNHPLGDLYRITADEYTMTDFILRMTVGTLVNRDEIYLKKFT